MAAVNQSSSPQTSTVSPQPDAHPETMRVDTISLQKALQRKAAVQARRRRRVQLIAIMTAVAPAVTAAAALIYAGLTGRWDIGLWAVVPSLVALLNAVAWWWSRKRLAPARHIICWSTLVGLGVSTFVFGISFGIMAAFMAWTILLFAILQSPRWIIVPSGVTITTVIITAALELLGVVPLIPLDPQAHFVGNVTIGLVFPLALMGTVHAYADYILDVLRGLSELIQEETRLLVASNQQVASSMHQQAAAVQEVSATAEELARTAEQLRAHSHQLSGVAQRAEKTAQEGAELVDTVLDNLSRLSENIQQLAQEVLRLSSHSQRIREIVDTIQQVSDDTHLIALNASIEAASATERGRRFGAIAAEMRRLSQNVLEASNEVKRLLPELQQGLQRIPFALEGDVQEAKEVGQRVHNAHSQLHQMLDNFHDISSAAQELQTVADQLAGVSEQIRLSLNELVQVTQRLTDTSRENAKTTQELASLVAIIPELGQ